MVDKYKSELQYSDREGLPLRVDIITADESSADAVQDSLAGTRLDPRNSVIRAFGEVLAATLPTRELNAADTELNRRDI